MLIFSYSVDAEFYERGYYMADFELDELDKSILDVIRNDARLSYSDIADIVGVSRVHVKNKMAKMEQNGVIKGYFTEICEDNTDNGIMFEMLFELEPENYDEIIHTLQESSIITDLHSITGNCKVLAIGYAKNSATLDTYARGLFKGLKGVTRLSWSTVLATYKKGGVIIESENDNRGDIT